jgi:hypothetical protein
LSSNAPAATVSARHNKFPTSTILCLIVFVYAGPLVISYFFNSFCARVNVIHNVSPCGSYDNNALFNGNIHIVGPAFVPVSSTHTHTYSPTRFITMKLNVLIGKFFCRF